MEASLLKVDITELPILDASFRAIPVYRRLFERVLKVPGDSEGKRKKQNIKEAAFIHLYTHFLIKPTVPNPYWKYSPELRYEKLVNDLDMPEGWEVDDVIQNAMNLYQERVATTFAMEFLDSAEGAARQTLNYLKNVDYERRDNKGNLVYKPLDVMKTIGQVATTLDDLEKARERVLNEQKITTSKVRGGGEVGSREVPKR